MADECEVRLLPNHALQRVFFSRLTLVLLYGVSVVCSVGSKQRMTRMTAVTAVGVDLLSE